MLVILSLIAGFVLLGFAADRFIESCIAIAEHYGMSPLLIGMLLVGFGTSFPEMVVSAMAAIKGNAGLSIGNVVGSNIANIGMCLGAAALIAPLTVHSRIVKKDYALLMFFSLIVGIFFYARQLTRIDGIVLILLLLAYLGVIFYFDKKSKVEKDAVVDEYSAEIPKHKMSQLKAWVWWLVALAMIFASSELLISSAVEIAKWFHVSDLIIGLTVVAIGTSLPELAATIMAARKNEHDIAVGNVVGSCVFNLLAVLPMPALISPAQLPNMLWHRDYPVMLGLTALLWVLTVVRPNKGVIGRPSGMLLLLFFVGYIALVVFTI